MPRSVLPTTESERIRVLDVLRGFALFGVLVVNASISARPFVEAVEMPAGAPRSEQIAWAVLNGAFVTKFVALFSFLFGMGLVLQCQRLVARRESPRLYLRRLGWLALFGLLHGCLLFEGDILFPYAVAGWILFLLRNRSVRFLVCTALGIYAIGLALEAWSALAPVPDDPEFEALIARAHEQGPLALLLQVRAIEYFWWLVLSSVTLFNWQVLALFLLGAAVMKRAWPQGEAGRFRRTAIVGLAAGVPLELAALLLQREDSAAAQVASTLSFSIGSLFLAVGYAGTVALVVRAELFPRLERALAAVGRTALTNYVGQSVLMNVLFLPFGLGLWNELSRWQVILVVSALFALQVALSALWLRRFAMGPLEWVWRRLTYGRGVALLRSR